VTADLNQCVALNSNSADAIFSNQVIEHLVDPRLFAAEVFRVLRPGGTAVVATPNVRYVRHLWRLAVQGHGPKTGNDDTRDGAWDNGHLHYFTHRDLREVFADAGFRSVTSRAWIDLSSKFRWLRRLFDRYAHTYLIREFLSGNALVEAQK
jgi:predicted SAM-dependent methyltransferase